MTSPVEPQPPVDARPKRWTLSRFPLLVVVLVVVAATYADSLRFGFVADARMLISSNRYLDSWSYFTPTLTHDYFWSSSGAYIPYWRPFTKLSWLIEAQLFGRAAWPFHAVQLLWTLVAVAGAALWARTLGLSRKGSIVAAFLFGLHPAWIEPGCLLMARSDVTATAGMIWSLAAWRSWTREGRARHAALHVVALVVALASKETAVIVAPGCTIWLVCCEKPSWRQSRTLLPAWCLTIAYLVLRRRFLGASIGAAIDPLRLFDGIGAYAAALIPFRLTTGLRNMAAVEAHAASTLVYSTLAWLSLAALAVWAVIRRERWLIALIAIATLSLLPVLLGPTPYVPGAEGKYALADRWLLMAASASSIGLAAVWARLRLPVQRIGLAAIGLWGLASMLLAPTLHGYYASDDTLLDLEQQQFLDTPERFRNTEDRCRARDREVAQAVRLRDLDRALTLLNTPDRECPFDASKQFNLLSALVQSRRYAEARPLIDPLLSHFTLDRRFHGPALFLAGMTYLRTGDPARAKPLLTAALREGVASCTLFGYLAEASSLLGRGEEQAKWTEMQRACAQARRQP